MYFRMLYDAPSGALSYLLADLNAGEAVLIDPRGPDLPVLQAMLAEHRLHLRWVLRTHAHEAADVTDAADARLAALPPPLLPPLLAAQVPEGGILPFGDEHIAVRATPGHTAGCLSFHWRDRLFCGDLLSTGECPQQPWPSAPQALWDSVTREVFTLPPETLLFAAHWRDGDHAASGAGIGQVVSTVLEQRRRHPWFSADSRDAFLTHLAALTPTPQRPS